MPTYFGAQLDEFGEWLNQLRTAKTVEDKKKVKYNINPMNMQEATVGFGAIEEGSKDSR